ncbi:unnamed protein product [Pelagomonas calceolata]|uniref:Uncharacterized protein n=1 Tax=Pelagomonas calceolata TaxID=35677 RepID=A0A8J2SHA5_9STRA|nr:unnamed protein product [Pelagomonas calceolata]
MDLNGPGNDAVQCLRAAIVAVLREEYSSAFVSDVTATSYVADGSTNTKVTFRVADDGINAEYVRNDLLSAVVESSNSDSNLMLALGDCWPYDDIDAEAASHVLQTETYRRAGFADVGAVVSSAVVMDGFTASYFNADAVSVAQFGVVVADVLRAATVQIDNVVAVNFYGLDEGNDGVDAIHSGTVARGSVIHFDVAIHYWPAGATVLETPEAIAQALLDALVAPTPTAFQKALDLYGTDPQFCDGCVLSSGVLNVAASQFYIDEVTMDGSHAVTSPPVPCTANCGGGGGGDDDDGLDEGEAAAVAIFVILAVVGVAGLIFWLYRSNKLRECCPSEEVEASAGELELDKVSRSATTAEPQTEMV